MFTPHHRAQMLALFAARRFGPLFVTQFLGAFNDNLFKMAFIFAVTFQWRADDPAGAAALATLAAGVFIAPYVLFSGLAGDLADRLDKARIARWVKFAEIGFMALGAVALALESVPMCFGALALMGLHSTIFGPVKYAILPQHLAKGELLLGTGLVEGGTFVAILLGQIAGGLLPTALAGPVAISIAVAGLVAARLIPPAPAAEISAEAGGQIDWNPVSSTRTALGQAFSSQPLIVATLSISWFWAFGAIFTSQFVPLARNDLGGDEAMATAFLAAFSIGVALGSAGVAQLLKGRISARLAAPSVVVMALAALDLYFAENAFALSPVGNIAGLLARPAGWRLLADLLLLALAGGVFSVPLYGILQTATPAHARARTIAANNIVNALFQVGGVLIIGAVLSRGVPVPIALAGAGLTGLLLIPLLRRVE